MEKSILRGRSLCGCLREQGDWSGSGWGASRRLQEVKCSIGPVVHEVLEASGTRDAVLGGRDAGSGWRPRPRTLMSFL